MKLEEWKSSESTQKNMKLDEDVKLDSIAKDTHGFVGADIA